MNTYITGIGKTKFGIRKESLAQLAYEAMYKAINDSNISITDIDAIYVANCAGSIFNDQLHINSLISSLLPGLHLPIIRIETACASGGVAINQAVQSLYQFENVLVLGVEKMTHVSPEKATEYVTKGGDVELDQKHGVIFPAAYALVAQQHMRKYKTTQEDLEAISLKNHAHARLNPLAHFSYKEVSSEDYQKSPIVSTPLRLFDCSPISDGACALVLSKKKSENAISILASQVATDSISVSQRKDLTSFTAARIAAKKAFEQANIQPKDLDIAEVHDCFTIAELIGMEDIGICEKGKAIKLLREGETKLDGSLPINTDGGLKADGHPIAATGVAQVYELVTQLRGIAGKRQVTDAKYGLAHNVGGVGGTAAITILQS